MEAKNKAIQLVEKFGDLAIDVVDEIQEIKSVYHDVDLYDFYEQVKQEIINLTKGESR